MLDAIYTNTDAHEYHQTSGNFGKYFAIHCRVRQKYLAHDGITMRPVTEAERTRWTTALIVVFCGQEQSRA
jgi:hypothetical protein